MHENSLRKKTPATASLSCVEYCWAEGKFDRLPVMAADLVRRNAKVIAAFGRPAALAAKAATSTTPIVFVTGNDPVTGVYLLIGGMEDKRLDLLQAGLIGVLINPRSPAIPAIHPLREFAEAGGLMSYGTNVLDVYYQNGIYVARILKGGKPSDLPVLQSTKFEFVPFILP